MRKKANESGAAQIKIIIVIMVLRVANMHTHTHSAQRCISLVRSIRMAVTDTHIHVYISSRQSSRISQFLFCLL